ncbi:MAG: guanylate kinase [Bacteroidetes bacterium]|nr:guanylate kinase [Bacteroidota bacterium]
MLFVLSAPSGSGKTTIARGVLSQYPDLRFSVSATTRPRRPNETEGKDYFFLTHDEFERRIADGDLVEWEEIYGNMYGTLRSEIDRVLTEHGHLLFDIDVKGALSLKEMYPDDAVLIFIRPPGLHILRERLERRGTDDPAVIDRRMERAAWELEQIPRFDHVVLNDDLSHSIPEVIRLIGIYMNGSKQQQ